MNVTQMKELLDHFEKEGIEYLETRGTCGDLQASGYVYMHRLAASMSQQCPYMVTPRMLIRAMRAASLMGLESNRYKTHDGVYGTPDLFDAKYQQIFTLPYTAWDFYRMILNIDPRANRMGAFESKVMLDFFDAEINPHYQEHHYSNDYYRF